MSQKITSHKKVNWTIVAIITAALIVALAILGYGYMDYRYKKESLEQKTRNEEQAREAEEQTKYEEETRRADNQQKYLKCKIGVAQVKENWWNEECKSRGLKENCSLPFANGDRIREWADKENDDCYKLFLSE